MVVTHFVSDSLGEYNSCRYRGVNILRALSKRGHKTYLMNIQSWMQDLPDTHRICSNSDLIVLHRVLVEESVPRALSWKSRGRAVVVDFDDSYGRIQDDNAAYQFWGRGEVEVNGAFGVSFKKKMDRHPLQQFIEALGQITGATMPSHILAEDWQAFGPCWYVPNLFESEFYLSAIRPPRNDGKIVIGYGGSMSHVPSFELSGIEVALQKIVRQYPHVFVTICGDKRVWDRLKLPESRKHHVPFTPWWSWPRILSQFDIGIAPLARRYDSSRSWIKAAEFGLMSIPFVATNAPPYQEWIEGGIGLYVPDGDDLGDGFNRRAKIWEEHLSEIIENLETQRTQMMQAQPFTVDLVDADKNAHKIEQTYEEIIQRG